MGALSALLGMIPESALCAIPKKVKAAKAGQSKALNFLNLHTGEKMDVSYFAKGRYSPAAQIRYAACRRCAVATPARDR